jgi:hypothetical protein
MAILIFQLIIRPTSTTTMALMDSNEMDLLGACGGFY